ncbi:MAG: rhodanese-like domain-containing protein [Vicingaceae bacterium]|nr:rhodanese-like domain-containing protein [Vicingaceae bacterium]
MKQLSLIIISTVFITSCGNSQTDTSKQQTPIEQTVQQVEIFIKNVDAPTFKEIIEKEDGIILDVRTPEEVASGHIPNANTINIYDEDFEVKINLLQKDKSIYVYCKAGGRSSKAAKLLKKNGFNKVYNLNGGITEWEKYNYPLTLPKKDTTTPQ